MNDSLLYDLFLRKYKAKAKEGLLMKKMYKRNLYCNFLKQVIFIAILAVLFLGMNNIYIQAQSDNSKYEKRESLYFQAREMFVASAPRLSEIVTILEENIPYFTEIENKQLRYYWLAKTAYLKGVVEKERNNHEKAEEDFSFSKRMISESLDMGDFSDGYRLLADVEGQLISYRNLYYKTKFGPGIRGFIVKAIELDSGNEKAYISLAMYYRDAPLIAGGNFKKSESILKEMIEITHSDKIDLFSLYLWIDTAWVNSDYNQEKVRDCISILNLFSNQADINFMAERIEKKYQGR
jgi:tetratricopeptide (TPR) repeat protein